jgi:hypothetical protein
MNIFNPQQLATLMYETPDRTGQTLKTIAKRMGGIEPKYLSRQLNPDDPGAKIGIEDFVYFTAVTDFEPLNYIEETFGRTAFFIPRLNADDPAPIMKLVAKISKEFGETVQEVAKALEDGVLDKKEIQRCRKENNDLIKACVEMNAYLEALDE